MRGEPSRHMDGQSGFGLGLSIANAIVMGHGGTLSRHDRLPRGLLVRLAFPIERGDALIDTHARMTNDLAVVV